MLMTMQDLIESDDIPLRRLLAIAIHAMALYVAFLFKTATKRNQ